MFPDSADVLGSFSCVGPLSSGLWTRFQSIPFFVCGDFQRDVTHHERRRDSAECTEFFQDRGRGQPDSSKAR